MKKIIIPLTLICFVFSLLFIPSKFLKVNATSVIQDIGIYYEVERVDERTRVTVTGQDIDIAIEAGRNVMLVSGPIIPPGGLVRPLSYGDTYASGIYFATPEDGKIIARHELKNDLDSLITILRILEQEAETFLNNNNMAFDNKARNNLVLEYVRTFNADYRSEHGSSLEYDQWGRIAGHNNSLYDFVDYVNSLSTGGIEIREYFASFLSQSSYYSAMGNVGSEYSNINLSFFPTGFDNVEVDLIHMFASMDGIFVNSYYNSSPLEDILNFSHNTVAFLASWGGDIQSLCNEFADYSNPSDFDIINDAFDPIDENGSPSSSRFMFDDLYADINAINIAFGYDLVDIDNLSEFIEDYFSSIHFSYMYDTFIDLICINYPSTVNEGYHKFKKCVFEMLDCNYDETTQSITISFDGYQITDEIKYYILNKGGATPTLNIRIEIGNQFSDFIFERRYVCVC